MRGTGFKLIYIILGITAAVLYLSGSSLKTMFNLRNDVSSYKKELSSLKKQNDDFLKELSWIETHDDYVKFLARKKLGMVAPGEIKLYIADKK